MEENLKLFGERIKRARTDKGITLVELSERIGCSQGYLSNLENGKRTAPSLKMTMLIISELDVSADFILYGKNARLQSDA